MDLIGLLMVLAGVVGEVWSAKKHNEVWESRWGYVLIVGLGLELIALPNHFVEASELRTLASKANERASTNELRSAQLESANLTLRSNVVALEMKLRPRTIAVEVERGLISKLSQLPKQQVLIQSCISDEEPTHFAEKLQNVFLKSGFTNVGLAGLMGSVSTDGVSVASPGAMATPLGGAVGTILFSAGIEGQFVRDTNSHEDCITIYVGQKPQKPN